MTCTLSSFSLSNTILDEMCIDFQGGAALSQESFNFIFPILCPATLQPSDGLDEYPHVSDMQSATEPCRSVQGQIKYP